MISIQEPGMRKVYVVCCYLPHANSNVLLMRPEASTAERATARDDWFSTLQESINTHTADADVIVTGDFNARTRDKSETAELEWEDVHEAGIPIPEPLAQYKSQVQVLPVRKSADVILNDWGQALLNFCAEQRLVILNGRLPGDETGALTYKGLPQGSGLLDYFLSSTDICMRQNSRLNVSRFDELPIVPAFSCRFDHAPVCLTLTVRKSTQTRQGNLRNAVVGQAYKQYKWRPERQDQYVQILKHDVNVQTYLGRVHAAPTSSQASHMLGQAVAIAAEQVMPTRRARRAGRANLQRDASRHRRNPWFDEECKRLREMKILLQRQNPNSPEARVAAQVYWQRVRNVRRLYLEQEMAVKVASWFDNQKEFWSDYKGDKSNSGPFDVSEWSDYFEGLLARNQAPVYDGGSLASHTQFHASLFPRATEAQRLAAMRLNDPITHEEVRKAMQKMHDGKSAGVDGIPAEFFVHAFPTDDKSLHVLIPEITHTFNLVFGGEYPKEWAECAIIPVPKSNGDPTDKDDYRGIAVGNAVSKLYSTVLLLRMDDWAEREGNRARGQAGFRAGRCTADNVFILQHALEKAKKNGKPVFAAFIDFRKAYDSVNRDLLWQSLESMGVNGALLHSLKQMYAHVGMRVRVDGRLGKLFKANVGVKQGDPLSPLLFGLFIDRFEQYLLDKCPAGGTCMIAGLLLQSLLYADDLVLLAESASQLQKMLDCLHDFSNANHMTVNIDKSKVVVFNNLAKWAGTVLYVGAPLPVVKEFVYLGTCFYSACNARGNIRKNLKRRLIKAKAALNCMKQRCRQLDLHHVIIMCGLFDSLVKSVINFGCEGWGVYHMHSLTRGTVDWGSGGEAESLHRSFLTSIFHVRKSTTIAPLMNEARRSPIMHSWFKSIVGWWNRIVVRPETDLVKQALKANVEELAFGGRGVGQLATSSDACWASAFYSMMCHVQPVMEAGRNVLSFRQISMTDIMQSLHEHWQLSVWGQWVDRPADFVSVRLVPDADSDGFKKGTYRSWFGPGDIERHEGFAYHLQTPVLIKAVARFRMSSHDLNIEAMRHHPYRRPRSLRTCPCCNNNSREDEMHIFECDAYQDIRDDFADILEVHNNDNLDAYMLQTMNPGHNQHGWYRLANFLVRVMAKRTALLADAV